MNLEPLWQHNPAYAAQRLGTRNGTTIGSHGCLITCITMANRAFNPGDNRMPNNVDDVFTNEHGYLNNDGNGQTSPAPGCNMVIWGKIPQLFPNVGLAGTGFYSGPADIGFITNILDRGGLAILKVFWKGNTNLPHYILAVGHKNGVLEVNDPETGKRVNFASKLFGTGDQVKDIYEAHLVGDAVPNVVPPPPEPAPAAPSNPEPGRGAAPVIEPPKEEEVTQAAHDAIVAELQRVQKIQLDEANEKFEQAAAIAVKQGQTIADLNAKLEANVPEYIRTETPDTGEYLTILPMDVVDFSDQHPPVPQDANLIVEAHSRFTIAGEEYVRSTSSAAAESYYGFNVKGLTSYQPLNPGPVAAPVKAPLTSSQKLHAAVADGKNFWERLFGKFNFGGLKK